MAIGLIMLAVSASARAAGQEEVILDEICPECEVVLEHVVTLGDAEGLGMLESDNNWVHSDSRGMYYVSSPELPYFSVFDPVGEIVRRVGARGHGPGEFTSTSAFLVGKDDSLYVFDPWQRRMSVFSPNHELVRTVSVSFAAHPDAALVETAIVVNAAIHTMERIGYPLHLLDFDGEIVRSFGSIDGVYRPDMRDIIDGRAMTSAEGDAVWTGWWNQYVLERWDTAGYLTQTLRRDVEWFQPWWTPTTDIEIPPQPVTQDLMQQGDTLWVLVLVADPNWRSAIKPDGRFFTVEDDNDYNDSVIEAIDLRNGQVRASTRFPRKLRGFAGPGLVYGQDIDPSGHIAIPLWDLNIPHPMTDRPVPADDRRSRSSARHPGGCGRSALFRYSD